ncbi:MAG: UDP-glucose 4-epimerase [Deltaproteobacteria bacterium HGW-Deltaproteobacteria-6]|nr:MAG: UDP-glucose 4-epimerase [Deltaproteobacteria bacterium HGW-Deltaproteobacteria-6]
MQKILVTGATGAVGPRVVTALCNAGYRVRTLSIDPPRVGLWPEGVEVVIGDVTDAAAVQAVVCDIDSVIHLAALLHIVNPPPALQKKYERINVGGTATVVEAALQSRVRRIIYFSTIAVYGSTHGRIVTEETPPHPDTFYSQTKLAAERIVLNARDVDGRRMGTVLRLGAIYGSGIKGNYERLLQSLARGRFLPVGDGSNRRTLVYDEDVARAAVLALQHSAAAGKIFNVSDGEFHTLNDIISSMCQALDRKLPRLSLPVGPVRFAAGLVEDLAKIAGIKPPIVRATVDKYTEDVAVDSRRIQYELGFVPQYDLSTGWQNAVREMRQSGTLPC